MDDLGFGIALFGGLLIFLIAVFVITLIMYVIMSLGLYKVAKREGYSNEWFAWIPILNMLLMIEIAKKNMPENLKSVVTPLYVILVVVGIVLSAATGGAFTIVLSVLYVVVFYYYMLYRTERLVLHMVVAILTLGSLMPVQLFWVRNREENKEETTDQ